MAQMTLRKLCWAVLGRWESLAGQSRSAADAFERCYHRTMALVRLTTDGFCTPRPSARARLEDVHAALANELERVRVIRLG